MKVTYITPGNAEYFEGLAPEGTLRDENLFCLGAIAKDGTACGVLVTGIYGETAYIEWIYTDPSYRRERAARSLFEMLRALLRKIDISIVLISYSDECEHLEEFLAAEGFFVDVDRENYSMPIVDLIYSETIDRLKEKHTGESQVVTLEGYMDRSRFFEYIHKNGISLLENEVASCNNSLILKDKSGMITGCLLIRKRHDGNLDIPYLISSGHEAGVTDLFLAFKELAIKNDWLEENVVFSDRSGEMIGFLEEVLGEDREHFIISGQKQGIRTL